MLSAANNAMKQAIAGVAPPELEEVGVMTVWPSIAATPPGQLIGRLCGIPAGVGVFTVGHLLALLLIPPAVGLLLMSFNPWTCRRYRLTNRRLVVQKGMMPVDERSVAFDDFDVVEIDVLPGQQWYPAGDLVFSKGPLEAPLKHLARWMEIDTRTLKKHNGRTSWWIKKLTHRKFAVWFTSKKKFAQANQNQIAERMRNDT